MKLLSKESSKNTRFIRCFDDGSGVWAKPITETERDALRRKARNLSAGQPRSDELIDRRFKCLCIKACVSDWEGFMDENDKPLKYSPDLVDTLFEWNPTYMGIVYQFIASEIMMTQEEEIKNSESGPTVEKPTK